jgi:hypothetical protein
MKEPLMMAAIGISPILFMLGGFRWKWLRRYVLPILLGIIAYLAQFPILNCLGYALGLAIALCLPYGERTPYWLKFVVLCAFSAPSLLLGFTAWQIVTPIVLIALFKLSNLSETSGFVPWKIWEGVAGGLVGITLSALISSYLT